MTKPIQHTRITALPMPEAIAAGRLDNLFNEYRHGQLDLVLEYHAFIPFGQAGLFERERRPWERTQGVYAPRRLRFGGVEELKQSGLYGDLAALPAEHPARTIVDMFQWIPKEDKRHFYLFFGASAEQAEVRFYARSVKREDRAGEPAPISVERDWSPTPSMPARLVPQPCAQYRRFGGDPVRFRLEGQEVRGRLFIGNLQDQPEQRPDGIAAVLNLSELPSNWVKGSVVPGCDRWARKGEGVYGMGVDEIRQEAGWVIERLRRGERVLVHCSAGMNRSGTICCAVLILLEGLSAEEALERVREHHPWAWPDRYHWLALRGLGMVDQ